MQISIYLQLDMVRSFKARCVDTSGVEKKNKLKGLGLFRSLSGCCDMCNGLSTINFAITIK